MQCIGYVVKREEREREREGEWLEKKNGDDS
jgi:hypothetical protein